LSRFLVGDIGFGNFNRHRLPVNLHLEASKLLPIVVGDAVSQALLLLRRQSLLKELSVAGWQSHATATHDGIPPSGSRSDVREGKRSPNVVALDG
jgi:hypothetical protein